MAKHDLEDRLINFSVDIIKIADCTIKSFAGNHLAGQLVRSGTSTALNYGEAQSAESRKDFIHKLKIGHKELKETLVCLKIIQRGSLCKEDEKLQTCINECNELTAIFTTSINTALSNLRKENNS